jgi:alpha-1,3-mannosyltransferase
VHTENGILTRDNLTTFVKGIIDPKTTKLPTLECPTYSSSRYRSLKTSRLRADETPYFFALNLRENLNLLPRLLGSVVEAIRFLGPERCALSIVEGNSPDGTAEVLAALEPSLSRLGLRTYFTVGGKTNPLDGGRFEKLAQLRNEALEPLIREPARYQSATVLFINDVAICPDDILELALQRQSLEADMTCAMDWTYGIGDSSMFYDSYVARAINGELFFDIPPETAGFEYAYDLFWNEAESKRRFEEKRPFQVFACWNGAVTFRAKPIVEQVVSFRSARDGECFGGEPTLFCKDLWYNGYGKIAVVPSVNLEYSIDNGRKIKGEKGFTADLVTKQKTGTDAITWRGPPDEYRCMPTFNNQFWSPWNASLPIGAD